MKEVLVRQFAGIARPYPPSSEGGSVEEFWRTPAAKGASAYPPSSEGGSVEGTLLRILGGAAGALSPLLGGGLR